VGGAGYRFTRWDLRLVYRYLHYDTSDDDLLQNVAFSGGGLSAKIRF